MNRGFYGLPIGLKRIERPFGMYDFGEEPCPTELPYWVPTGWRLVAVKPLENDGRYFHDPYIIYDQWDNMLHVWEQEYPPSYAEVLQVCNRLLSK